MMRSTSGTMTMSSPAAKFVQAEAKYQANVQNLDSSANSSGASSFSSSRRNNNQDAAENRAPPQQRTSAVVMGSRAQTEPQQQQQQQPKKDRYTVQFNGNFSLTTQEQIGKGGFARVFAARTNNGELYALKVCENMNESTWRRLQEEVRILQLLSGHRNIVKLYAAARVENNAFLAMEKCVQRNLHDIIISSIQMKLDEVLWVGRQLATALVHIHKYNCIHRDLKPQNILFDHDGDVKVIDFGLSTRAGDKNTTRRTVAGTAVYMAPEMASHYMRTRENDTTSVLSYGQELDIWSYGIVLYVMATGISPYWKTNHTARNAQNRNNNNNNATTDRNALLLDAVSKHDWDWPPNYKGDSDLMDLIESVLTSNRELRPSVADIVSHRVFRRCPEYCPDSLKIRLGIISQVEQDVAPATSPLSQRSANNNNTNSRNNNNNNNRMSNNNSRTFGGGVSERLNPISLRQLEREWGQSAANIVTQRTDDLAEFDEQFVFGFQELDNRDEIMREERDRRRAIREQLRDIQNRILQRDAAAFSSSSSSNNNTNRSASRPSSILTSKRRDMSVTIETKPIITSSFRGRGMSLCGIEWDNKGGFRVLPIQATFGDSDELSPNQRDASQSPRNNNTSRLVGGGSITRHRGRSMSLAEGRESTNKFLQQLQQSPKNAIIDMTPKCLNGHPMKRYDKMPFYCSGYNYNEVSCDSCKRSFKKLGGTTGDAILRCVKCDFDVCEECVNSLLPQSDQMNKIYCFGCNKAFPPGIKYTNHAKKCKGPSCSPAREDGTARQTMMMTTTTTTTNAASRSSSTGSSTAGQDIPRVSAHHRRSGSRNVVDLEALSVADDIELNVAGESRSTSRRGVLRVEDEEEFRSPNDDDIMIGRGATNSRRSTASTSSNSRKSVSFANSKVQQDAAATGTATATVLPNQDDDEDLSPIQRAIRERHSQRLSDSALLSRGSALPQPGDLYQPKQQEVSYPDLLQAMAESNIHPKRMSRSRSRSRSVSSSEGRNSGNNNNKLHRSEEDAGDQPGRNHQNQIRRYDEQNYSSQNNSNNNSNNNMMMINVPPNLTGTTTSSSRGRNSRSRGRSIADMMKQNNVQGFNGPAGNSFTDDENNNSTSPRNSEQTGPFFLKTDRNGRQYFVDSQGNPAQLNGNNSNNMNITTTTSRSRGRNNSSSAGISAPSAHRQGGTIRRGGSASTRGVSKPADRVDEPNKPLRGPNGKFHPRNSVENMNNNNNNNNNNIGNNQMMLMNMNANQNNQNNQQQQAFLALPRRDEHRERFTREFLAGSWIRHYAFATNDVAFLYYCLQPGRYGAFYQKRDNVTGATSTATVVIDVHTRLVLYVPSLRGDGSRTRHNANGNSLRPTRHYRDVHVETDYDEEARVMSLAEAQQYAGPAIGGILDYVNEITRMKAEGQVPIFVPAAHIQNAADGSVPADTKFVYLRRVFPDPGGSFALFRLSNMRSQIICNAQYDFDIRWQTEKNTKIGMKYYVYRNGTAQPFSMDNTGLLSRVEKILSEQFLTKK